MNHGFKGGKGDHVYGDRSNGQKKSQVDCAKEEKKIEERLTGSTWVTNRGKRLSSPQYGRS